MDDFKVQLFKNQANSKAVTFQVKKSWDLSTFKKKAGQKVGVSCKKVFLGSGSEVTGVDEMQANEELYLSSGEPFYKSGGKSNEKDTFYISVLGTGGVGKSALTLRFVRDHFVQDWDPTIEDAYRKPVDVDEETCALDILDTAGQDDFESLRPSWMIEKDAYIFVFSLDQPESLNELNPFIELHHQLNSGRTVPIVLAANKVDKTDNLNKDELAQTRASANAIAEKLSAKYIETSARTGDNVQESFESIVRQIRRMRKPVKVAKKEKCVVM